MTGSDRIGLTQEGPGLLCLDLIKAGLTEQESAQVIEDEARLGIPALLTGSIRVIQIDSSPLIH